MGKKSKDKRDIYYRKAKEQGWRARSAFKLIQIADKYNLFMGVKRAVDLCAAPGSWSQVLSRRLYLGEELKESTDRCIPDYHEVMGIPKPPPPLPPRKNENAKIVAVDLQPMSPLPGVIQLQGDITKYSTAQEIITHFEGEKADLVICDGAPDVTGLHDMDIYIQSQLLLGALHITCNVLKTNGNFVAKIFRGKQNSLLVCQLKMLFKEIHIFKPPSSRNSSTESFIIGINYTPPDGFDPTLMTQYLGVGARIFDKLTGVNRIVIPFIVCGDLSQFDSDATYPLQIEGEAIYDYKLPVQPPLNRRVPWNELKKLTSHVGFSVEGSCDQLFIIGRDAMEFDIPEATSIFDEESPEASIEDLKEVKLSLTDEEINDCTPELRAELLQELFNPTGDVKETTLYKYFNSLHIKNDFHEVDAQSLLSDMPVEFPDAERFTWKIREEMNRIYVNRCTELYDYANYFGPVRAFDEYDPTITLEDPKPIQRPILTEKKVRVAINLPDYSLEGEGILIPELLPAPPTLDEASGSGSTARPHILSVVDYYTSPSDNVDGEDPAYLEMKKTLYEALNFNGEPCSEGVNRFLDKYKSDIQRFHANCTCGRCGV